MAAAGDQSICSGGLRLGRPELKARPECGDLWWWMGRGLEQVTVVRRRDRQNWPGRGADGRERSSPAAGAVGGEGRNGHHAGRGGQTGLRRPAYKHADHTQHNRKTASASMPASELGKAGKEPQKMRI